MTWFFNYSDVVNTLYFAADIAVVLTPEQHALAWKSVDLLNNPRAWGDYDASSDAIDALVASTQEALNVPVSIPPDTFLEHYLHLHLNSMPFAGNPIALTIVASQIMNHYAAMSPAAQLDQWRSEKFWLMPGAYEINLLGVQGVTSGILTLQVVDPVSGIARFNQQIDLYHNGSILNYHYTGTWTQASRERVYLRGFVDTKNAASSGYVCAITFIEVHRTDG